MPNFETEIISIRTLIGRVIDDTGISDVVKIAEESVNRIPEDEQRQVLVDLLINEARIVLNARRNQALNNVFTPKPTSSSSPLVGGSIQTAPKGGARGVHKPGYRRGGGNDSYNRPGYSPKVDRVSEWWTKLMSSTINVGPNKWMPLGRCGVEQLVYAENIRRRNAENETNYAKMYLALRGLLDKYDVETVEMLPPEAVQAVVS